MELNSGRGAIPSLTLKLLLCGHWRKQLVVLKCRNSHHVWSTRPLHTSVARRIPTSLKQSYSLLDVDENCSENELRNAFLKKVKQYHPDSNSTRKDSDKFNQVQEAYQIALEHRKNKTDAIEIEEIVSTKANSYEHDIEHTVPQHRRYLTLEGIGTGTPSQRQRQYKQYRVHQATEHVFEHRKMKLSGDENALTLSKKDSDQARKIKISNFIQRVVDDLVRESMQKGDFDDLPGKGKPLDYSAHNPMVDSTTHNINKILVNNGFKPEWIMLSKDIRDSMRIARERLAVIREQLGPPPYSETDEIRWDFHVEKFKTSVSDINSQINRLNNIVPLMDKQMVHYDPVKNMKRVLDDHKHYLPKEKEDEHSHAPHTNPVPHINSADRINWGEVWTNIKELFRSR